MMVTLEINIGPSKAKTKVLAKKRKKELDKIENKMRKVSCAEVKRTIPE